MANLAGKRYFCEVCGAEYIVTKTGEGTMVCCGQPMTLKVKKTEETKEEK